MRELQTTPHVAQNTGRKGGSAIDGRTVRHPGYAVSQRKRKLVEQVSGQIGDAIQVKQFVRFQLGEAVE